MFEFSFSYFWYHTSNVQYLRADTSICYGGDKFCFQSERVLIVENPRVSWINLAPFANIISSQCRSSSMRSHPCEEGCNSLMTRCTDGRVANIERFYFVVLISLEDLKIDGDALRFLRNRIIGISSRVISPRREILGSTSTI